MAILRAFLALLAGFATMAALVTAITAALMKFAPRWVGATGNPRIGYILVNLGYSLVAAAAGGYITACVARDKPLVHVLALALIVLLIGALSALQQRGKQLIWYQLLLIATTPSGVFIGGLIWIRISGNS